MSATRSRFSKLLLSKVPNQTGLPADVWKVPSIAIPGLLLEQIDSTVANVSLSSLATVLQRAQGTIHWLAIKYLLIIAVLLPMNGWLVDLVSTRTLFHLRGEICISQAGILCRRLSINLFRVLPRRVVLSLLIHQNAPPIRS
jgi:hypothetical protein